MNKLPTFYIDQDLDSIEITFNENEFINIEECEDLLNVVKNGLDKYLFDSITPSTLQNIKMNIKMKLN